MYPFEPAATAPKKGEAFFIHSTTIIICVNFTIIRIIIFTLTIIINTGTINVSTISIKFAQKKSH